LAEHAPSAAAEAGETPNLRPRMAVFNRNAPYSETSDPNALIVIEPEYPAVFSISYDHGYCVRNRGEI
jgi:hypothetical protein